MPANPATGPDEFLVDRLAAQLGTLTKGTNLFFGPEIPPDGGATVPHLCVFCLGTGGPPAEGFFSTDEVERRFTVQIIVRSNVDLRVAGLALARSIYPEIHEWVPGTGGYFNVVVREADPVYLGLDDTEHHRWANNVELWYKG